MLITLRRPKDKNDHRPEFKHLVWKKSLPFVWNPRGVMIHRAKSVHTYGYFSNSKLLRNVVHFWCGNFCNNPEFYSDPPENRLLCVRCEALATQAGELSADELAGRHVHIGKAIAVRTCCQETPSN